MSEPTMVWSNSQLKGLCSIIFEEDEDGEIVGNVCYEEQGACDRWGWAVVSHGEGRNEGACLAEGSEASREAAKQACTLGWLNWANKRVMGGPPEPTPFELFYIRSLKHERGYGKKENTVIWWGPESRGYTTNLALAGKYARAEAEAICGMKNSEMLKNVQVANNVMVPVLLAAGLTTLTVGRHALNDKMASMADRV